MFNIDFRKHLIKTISFIAVCLYLIPKSCSIKKQYFSLEHPKTILIHPQYFCNLVFKSRQKSRANPIHYVDVNITNLKTLDKNYKASASFYQLLSNVYKPSFVELSMPLCDAFQNEFLITPAFIEGFNRMPQDLRPMPELKCPVVPGNYSFTNMVMPINNIPAGFPFRDGRLFVNISRGKTVILSLHIDFQLLSIDM